MQVDPKVQKKFDKWLKEQQNKPTKKERDEIRALEKKCLSFWRRAVIKHSGRQCEMVLDGKRCRKTKHLNAHHIESYATNKFLRYSLPNGVALCPTHHKFGRFSAHHSFCVMYQFLIEYRVIDLEYLSKVYRTKENTTKDWLKGQIDALEAYI